MELNIGALVAFNDALVCRALVVAILNAVRKKRVKGRLWKRTLDCIEAVYQP